MICSVVPPTKSIGASGVGKDGKYGLTISAKAPPAPPSNAPFAILSPVIAEVLPPTKAPVSAFVASVEAVGPSNEAAAGPRIGVKAAAIIGANTPMSSRLEAPVV